MFGVEMYSVHKGEEFVEIYHFDKSAVPTFLVTLSLNLSRFSF
jgi:hypothetical protein